MRALLVCNPHATTTDVHVRDVIASALASQVDLEVEATKQRGQAVHLAAGAVHEDFDAVFVLGGDGTANEVIQALAGTEVALGVIPGGGTNVLARSLGLPNRPVEATAELLERLRAGRLHRVSLGRADARYFAFNAGFGFDAAVVRRVERRPRFKRAFKQASFVECAFEQWFRGRRDELYLDPGADRTRTDGPYMIAIVGNSDPYTFLGPRPMRVTPDATFDAGLDLVGVRPVGTVELLGVLARVFTSARHTELDHVDAWHDLARFTLHAPRPQPLMVDGDYAGEHHSVTFHAVRQALTVFA